MGRNKKSIETIVAEGKSHLTKKEIEKRREQESKLIGNADNMQCPKYLKDKKINKSEVKKLAENEYNRVLEELRRLNIVSNLDKTVLGIYSDAYANYVKITEQLKHEKLTIQYTNKKGHTNTVENPLIKIQMKYIDVIMKCSSKLGLSISDRLKLVVPESEDKPKNKFEEFVN